MEFIRTEIVCKKEKKQISKGIHESTIQNNSLSGAIISELQNRNGINVNYDTVEDLTERLGKYISRIEKELKEAAR